MLLLICCQFIEPGAAAAALSAAATSKEAAILSSMPGMGGGFTAVSLACRVGRVERFPRAHSLAQLLVAHAWLSQQRRE
jgi:hypothetical protein